jgi:hypothetical protein
MRSSANAEFGCGTKSSGSAVPTFAGGMPLSVTFTITS